MFAVIFHSGAQRKTFSVTSVVNKLRTMKLFGLIVTLSGLVAVTVADDSLCAGQKQNSFVADPSACTNYFLCQNERAISGVCPNNLWFDPIRIGCANPGPFCTPPPCQGQTGRFVQDTAMCGAWHFCVDGSISHSDICPHGLTFEPSTQYCTYPFCNGMAAISSSDHEVPHVLL